MKLHIRTGRWGALGRTAAAVACASVMTFVGLPAAAHAAPQAKPLNPGVPCKDYFGLADDIQAIAALPQFDASRAKSQWDSYDYENPAKKWDGLQAPSDADIARLKDLATKPPKSKPVDRIYWTWLKARAQNPNAWGDFSRWRDIVYIRNAGNAPRGKAFEKKVIKDHGLTGPEWICQKEVEFYDPDSKKTYRRELDAYNTRTKQILEIKSNGQPDPVQVPKDIAWSKDPKWRDSSMKYVYAEPQKQSAVDLKEEMRKNAGAGRVTEYNYRADKVEKAPSGGVRYKSDVLQAPGRPGTAGGGLNDAIRESRPSPKSMGEFLNQKNAADPSRLSPRGPGGVDFTTLELRYVGKPVKGKGLDYGFSANSDPDEQSGWGGKEKSQLISDAFFTWLALTPEKFWVNLNPDQPDRVGGCPLPTHHAGVAAVRDPRATFPRSAQRHEGAVPPGQHPVVAGVRAGTGPEHQLATVAPVEVRGALPERAGPLEGAPGDRDDAGGGGPHPHRRRAVRGAIRPPPRERDDPRRLPCAGLSS